MPDTQNIIVLCLDGVGAAWLGPYGGTLGETPAWNQLAAESLLFDFCYSASPELPAACEALWRDLGDANETARHAALMTDQRVVAELPSAAFFAEHILSPAAEQRAANAIDETQAAQLFASAAQWLASASHPFLFWLHSDALYGPWDAPYELRLQDADEEDPDPPDFVQTPRLTLAESYDPDELLGFMQAHGGQVAALDWALNALLDDLSSSGLLASSILVVTATRGFALGEHGEVGGGEHLHSELLHVPLLIRFPDQRYASHRSQRIFPASELGRVLASAAAGDWPAFERRAGFEEPIADSLSIAVSRAGTRTAVRTPGWFLTEDLAGARRLYAKPDDRWEVNEVSSRCEDAVTELEQLLEQFDAAEAAGATQEVELSKLLREGYDA